MSNGQIWALAIAIGIQSGLVLLLRSSVSNLRARVAKLERTVRHLKDPDRYT